MVKKRRQPVELTLRRWVDEERLQKKSGNSVRLELARQLYDCGDRDAAWRVLEELVDSCASGGKGGSGDGSLVPQAMDLAQKRGAKEAWRLYDRLVAPAKNKGR